MHEFQKQMDYVLLAVSMYVAGVLAKYFIPGVYKLLRHLQQLFQRSGDRIINFFSHIWQTISWFFSIGLPDSEYCIEFESRLEELSSDITGTIPASFIADFDDDHYSQHGRVYLRLFQIARCMKCHAQNILDLESKRRLESQVKSVESVMQNYRFLTSSQIIQVYAESFKLKHLFQLL
jgi:hypothetical protein